MKLTYQPYESAWVAQLRNGGVDAYGNLPERAVSNGNGNPCRHCLQQIAKGKEMLIVAARPFPKTQPYAETGPIFLCADHCDPYDGKDLPPCVSGGEDRLLKAYSTDHRILYGSGAIVAVDKIPETCQDILSNADVAFVDVRSSLNNCFTFRVTRGETS